MILMSMVSVDTEVGHHMAAVPNDSLTPCLQLHLDVAVVYLPPILPEGDKTGSRLSNRGFWTVS